MFGLGFLSLWVLLFISVVIMVWVLIYLRLCQIRFGCLVSCGVLVRWLLFIAILRVCLCVLFGCFIVDLSVIYDCLVVCS